MLAAKKLAEIGQYSISFTVLDKPASECVVEVKLQCF
jgi:hypothetical protein